MKAIVHFFAGSALSVQTILMCCECCMSLRVLKYRERKGKVLSVHVPSTLPLCGFKQNICYWTLGELLDFLILKVTTSQHYIIFTF